jgi:hypothetical protein
VQFILVGRVLIVEPNDQANAIRTGYDSEYDSDYGQGFEHGFKFSSSQFSDWYSMNAGLSARMTYGQQMVIQGGSPCVQGRFIPFRVAESKR